MIKKFYLGNKDTGEILKKRNGEFLLYDNLGSATKGIVGYERWHNDEPEIFKLECEPEMITGESNSNVIKLIKALKEKDESTYGIEYERISLSDYDGFSSGLEELLGAWNNQEIVFFDSKGNETICSSEEKRLALKSYLHGIADKL